MKTAISVPDEVFFRVARLAKSQGVSRSSVFTSAAREYVRTHRAGDVTERLNAVYSKTASSVDPVLEKLQTATLPKEDW